MICLKKFLDIYIVVRAYHKENSSHSTGKINVVILPDYGFKGEMRISPFFIHNFRVK